MNIPACILCSNPESVLFHRDKTETHYFRCPVCDLTFLHPQHRLPPHEEVKRYDLHENDPRDPNYRAFLEHLFHPLSERLEPGSRGLDFGAGPGPTLHLMFEEQGHHMRIYDPFYANDPSVFEVTYDFITSTEVIEHLFRPGEELDSLWSCLNPNGFFGIMTKRVTDGVDFPAWHYRKDDTHVAFYSDMTFRWLADRWNASLDLIRDDVAIMRKSG